MSSLHLHAAVYIISARRILSDVLDEIICDTPAATLHTRALDGIFLDERGVVRVEREFTLKVHYSSEVDGGWGFVGMRILLNSLTHMLRRLIAR